MMSGSFGGFACRSISEIIIFEQLEERIVLDGAVDDVSSRADLFSGQFVDVDSVADSDASEAVATYTPMGLESLTFETGSETLPDGTWHYWERDEWATDNNGYEFHAWQDGSSSFHQVQWDAVTNSRGTHNGFDYNLQRNGSWAYQAVQWDANQNGYSYDATSYGTYTYETQQWFNGMGHHYTSNSTNQWTYHVLQAGTDPGDVIDYQAFSGGFWEFCYSWANGVKWHTGDGQWHDVGNGWSRKADDDSHYMIYGVERFMYDYGDGQWFDHDANGNWNPIGSKRAKFIPDFIGDGQPYGIGFHDNYSFRYDAETNLAYYSIHGLSGVTDKFHYSYDSGLWQYKSPTSQVDWYSLGTDGMSSDFGTVGMDDVGLRWSFAKEVDPSSFGFNPNNTTNAYIKYDSDDNGSLDRILYYDDAGHKVAEGLIQYGSMGIRIGVDKSYVGASSDWSSYWPFWENPPDINNWTWSWNYEYKSPLVTVYDSHGNQLFKQTAVQYIPAVDITKYGGFRDGEAWIWEDANGNGMYDSNLVTGGDKILHWRQQSSALCWLYAVMNIDESVKGNGLNGQSFPVTYEDDTIYWASTHGNLWPVTPVYDPRHDQAPQPYGPAYDPSTMDLHENQYVFYGSASDFNVLARNYLISEGFAMTPVVPANEWTDLISLIDSGKVVVVGIDYSQILATWFDTTDGLGHAKDADHDGYLDAGYVTTGCTGHFTYHVVWLRGFQTDSQGNITHAILESSQADSWASWSASLARVPIDHFVRAYDVMRTLGISGYGYGVAPSGWEWSAAGINTWQSNPAVYSSSW